LPSHFSAFLSLILRPSGDIFTPSAAIRTPRGLSGINNKQNIVKVFVLLLGALTGVAALIFTARVGSALRPMPEL
jgi:hypothetical protein